MVNSYSLAIFARNVFFLSFMYFFIPEVFFNFVNIINIFPLRFLPLILYLAFQFFEEVKISTYILFLHYFIVHIIYLSWGLYYQQN